MRKLFIFLLIFSFLLLAGASCIQIGGLGGKSAVIDGGVFRSVDKGNIWLQKTQILAVGGQRKDFGNINIISLALDPSDHKAVYAGSAGSGLFYSYDAGESWQQPAAVSAGVIKSTAIDPKNKCVIYIAVGNQILKSIDCSRTWAQVYQDARPEVVLNQVLVDSYNSNHVYVGNSVGDLIKSTDTGKSWSIIYRFENPIAKMIINPADTRKIYIGTQDRGIFRTGDAGKSFTELNQGLKQYGGAFVFHDLVLMDGKSESLLLACQYGLIKTGDAGVSWQALTLLTPPSGADIKVVGINPQNSQEIFYATPTTFYQSFDGGVKWITKKLASTRLPAVFLIDPADPKIMYLGFFQVKK